MNPLRGQSNADVDAQVAAIRYVLSEKVEVPSFCVQPAARAFSYTTNWADTVDVLAPPSRGEFDALRIAAKQEFGHHSLPYCLIRPKDGFESDLERVLTYTRRRAEGGLYFGRTFWQVGPYGEAAVRIEMSKPRMLGPGRAEVGMSYGRGGGSHFLRCELRLEGATWIVEDCTGFTIRA